MWDRQSSSQWIPPPPSPHRQTDRWGLSSASWESREGTRRNFWEWLFKASSFLSLLSKKRGLVIFVITAKSWRAERGRFGLWCYSRWCAGLILSPIRFQAERALTVSMQPQMRNYKHRCWDTKDEAMLTNCRVIGLWRTKRRWVSWHCFVRKGLSVFSWD